MFEADLIFNDEIF